MSAFHVWRDDEDEEEARTVDAYDHELAAGEWAEQWDSVDCEYPIAEGEVVTVCVREDGSSEVKKFRVRGEFTTYYHAEEVDG